MALGCGASCAKIILIIVNVIFFVRISMLLFTRLADRILTVAPLLHGSVCLLSVVCHVCIVAKQYIRYRKTV